VDNNASGLTDSAVDKENEEFLRRLLDKPCLWAACLGNLSSPLHRAMLLSMTDSMLAEERLEYGPWKQALRQWKAQLVGYDHMSEATAQLAEHVQVLIGLVPLIQDDGKRQSSQLVIAKQLGLVSDGATLSQVRIRVFRSRIYKAASPALRQRMLTQEGHRLILCRIRRKLSCRDYAFRLLLLDVYHFAVYSNHMPFLEGVDRGLWLRWLPADTLEYVLDMSQISSLCDGHARPSSSSSSSSASSSAKT
jgi:hypothetical protein